MSKGREVRLKVVRASVIRGISNHALAVVFCALGCSGGVGGGKGATPGEARTALGGAGGAYQQFDRALRAMADHDTADDWTDVHCNEVANAFIGAWKADNTLREGLY